MFMFNNKKQLKKQELIELVAEYGAHRHAWNNDYFQKIKKHHGSEIAEVLKKESRDEADELFGIICARIKSL